MIWHIPGGRGLWFSFIWSKNIPDRGESGSTEARLAFSLHLAVDSMLLDKQSRLFICFVFIRNVWGHTWARTHTHTPCLSSIIHTKNTLDKVNLLTHTHTHLHEHTHSTCLSSCLSLWVCWLSWVRGLVDSPLPVFVRLLLLHNCSLGCYNKKYSIKSLCFLRLSPYLDNLVLSRAEEELARSTVQLLFAFILSNHQFSLHKETFSNLIKTSEIKTLRNRL